MLGRTTWDWLVLGFAVISFAALLRVGEAASCRPQDLASQRTVSFFDDRRADDLRTTRLGAWAEGLCSNAGGRAQMSWVVLKCRGSC